MRTLTQWLDAYGQSHQHPINQRIHTIAVPGIFFCGGADLVHSPHYFVWHDTQLGLARSLTGVGILFSPFTECLLADARLYLVLHRAGLELSTFATARFYSRLGAVCLLVAVAVHWP